MPSSIAKASIEQAKTLDDIKAVFFEEYGFTESDYESGKRKTDYVDVGEKIGGARKDIWTPGTRRLELSDVESLESGEASKLVTKQNVMEGVFESILENQPEPAAAWMMDKVISSISPKPEDTDAARLGFVAAIENVQEYFSGITTFDDFKKAIGQIKDEIRGYTLSHEEAELQTMYKTASDNYQKARQAKWREIIPKYNKGRSFKQYEAGMELGTWESENRESFLPQELASRYYKASREWNKREEDDPQSKRNQYRALGKRFIDAVTLQSKAFVDNLNSAQRTITDMSWLEKTQTKKRGKTEKPKWVREVPEIVERVGGTSKEFKPKDLLETFKIRGVEYGNWMDEESSQHHTQMLGESFMDLSDILGVPLEHISYGGRLAIAFGARGSGAASAHYEPDKKAINMTKLNGGGSLAHEWAHFLDNVVHMVSTGGDQKHGYCSGKELGDKIDPEIQQVFSELNKAMNEGNVRPQRSEKLPDGTRPFWPFYSTPDFSDPQSIMDKLSDAKRTKYSRAKGRHTTPAYSQKVLKQAADYIHTVTGKEVTYGEGVSAFYNASRSMAASANSYWTRPHEMFARAFEAYINKKLKDRGAKNTYLVSGIPNAPDMPYPVGDELAKLEPIFDKLIESLKKHDIFESVMQILEATDIEEEAQKAATSPENDLPEPTEAQKISGVYKKGHISIAGMDIAIENPAGSDRSGIDQDGNEWSIKMTHHYGYVKGSIGKDKDHIDVFINPDLDKAEIESLPVFVVDQTNADGSFDEHKCVLGYDTEKEAREAYLSNYEKGWTGLGAITEIPMNAFKAWVFDKKQTKKAMVLESAYRDTHGDYGCILAELPEAEAIVIRNFAQSLPDEDFLMHPDTGEKWVEEKPHITIKYGILPSTDVKSVAGVLAGAGTIKGTYGKLGVFYQENRDVLYINANSSDLLRINGMVSKQLPCKESEYQYSPHVSLAYLKKGSGEKYDGMKFFSGINFSFNRIEYSDIQGNNFPMDL